MATQTITLEQAMRDFLQDVKDGKTTLLDVAKCRDKSESVLEQEFWHFIEKMNVTEFESVESQVRMLNYRVDSLFRFDGKRIVIELDGKEFHNPKRDAVRDAEILGAGLADEIIRIPYPAMHYYHDATMACLGHWHTRLWIARAQSAMTVEQLQWEIKSMVQPDSDFPTEESAIEWLEPGTDVYRVHDTHGEVGSPRAFLLGWKRSIILRRVASP